MVLDQTKNGWKPIETAPKDGTAVLICINQGTAFDAWWDQADQAWVDGRLNRYEEQYTYSPTHWMPMPEPPVEG